MNTATPHCKEPSAPNSGQDDRYSEEAPVSSMCRIRRVFWELRHRQRQRDGSSGEFAEYLPAYVEPDFAGRAHTVVDPIFSVPPASSSSSSCLCLSSQNFVSCSKVTYGSIILGPRGAAAGTSLVRCSLLDRNVTAIVNCTPSVPCHHLDIVEYTRVPVWDEYGADILPYLWGATAFIEAHLSGKRTRRFIGGDTHEAGGCDGRNVKSDAVADAAEGVDESESGFKSSQDDLEDENPSDDKTGTTPLGVDDEATPEQGKKGGGGSVLIHCEMGVSRSASVVAAYLIRYRSMSAEEAISAVQRRRPAACPNPGFVRQLAEFERAVRAQAEDATIGAAADKTYSLSFPFDGDDDARMEWAKRSSATHCSTGRGSEAMADEERGNAVAASSSSCYDVGAPQQSTAPAEKKVKTAARRKNAIFFGAEDILSSACFGDFSFLRSDCDGSKVRLILGVALDYVWSRGVLDIDLDWLCDLCIAVAVAVSAANSGAAIHSSCPNSVNIVRTMALDESSEFRERWSGEVYPGQLEQLIRKLDGLETLSPSSCQ